MHRHQVHSLGVDAQLAQQILEKFTRVALGLEHEHGARGIVKFVEKLVQQSRLAHSRFSDERKEPAPLFDTRQKGR